MLPNQSPAEGDRGDRLDDAVNWAVSEGDDYYNWLEGAMEPEAFCVNLSDALQLAKKVSHQGVAQYVWPHPAPEGERGAIAIAIGGVLYRAEGSDINAPSPTNGLRSAFPWVTPGDSPNDFCMEPGLSKREWFAAMAMQGLLAAECAKTGDVHHPDHLAELAIVQANSLLGAFTPTPPADRACEELLAELRGDKA